MYEVMTEMRLTAETNVSDEFSKQGTSCLEELGLNKYETDVYLTLIQDGMATAKDIANITGIPYGKVYEIIDSLCSKGFVYVLPSKPMRYQATSPKVVLESTKKDIEKRLMRIEQRVVQRLEPLFQGQRKGSSERGSFLLMQGRASIFRKVERLMTTSSKCIDILTTKNGLKRLVAHKGVLQQAVARGVSVRIVAPLIPETTEDVRSLGFCTFRHEGDVFNTMYCFDAKETLVVETTPDDENYMSGRDVGVYSTSTSFSQFMEMFYSAFFISKHRAEPALHQRIQETSSLKSQV